MTTNDDSKPPDRRAMRDGYRVKHGTIMGGERSANRGTPARRDDKGRTCATTPDGNEQTTGSMRRVSMTMNMVSRGYCGINNSALESSRMPGGAPALPTAAGDRLVSGSSPEQRNHCPAFHGSRCPAHKRQGRRRRGRYRRQWPLPTARPTLPHPNPTPRTSCHVAASLLRFAPRWRAIPHMGTHTRRKPT